MAKKNEYIKQNMDYKPVTELSISKSNAMVSAKYNASLLENQVMALALARIEVQYSDRTGESSLEAKLYPWELKKLVSDETHISRDMAIMGKRLPGHTMFLEDGRGNWKTFSMCPNAEYNQGVLTIKFNDELKNHVLGLDARGFYSVAQLPVLLNVNSAASFRLYELLNKEAYRCDPRVNGGQIDIIYNLSELRFMIGVANNDDSRVKNSMSTKGDHVDWDELYDTLDKKDKKYEKWYDFSRYVLKPAQDELNEISDISFTYECVREGKRAASVLFHLKKKAPGKGINEKKKLIEEMNKNRYRKLFERLVGHNGLTEKDIQLLLEKANNKEQLVWDAVERADAQPEIKNYMGWIIRCIERGYETVGTLKGSAERYQDVAEIVDGINEDEVSVNAWNRYKSKVEFPQFEEALLNKGFTVTELENALSSQECFSVFLDWKMGRSIDAMLSLAASRYEEPETLTAAEDLLFAESEDIKEEPVIEKVTKKPEKKKTSKQDEAEKEQLDDIISKLSEDEMRDLLRKFIKK